LIRDLNDGDRTGGFNVEVCVVGAGAVGLMLATALSERGVDVLVLEGGGRREESASQSLQEGESVGHPFENIGVGRYRVLGGTTKYWGGQVVPFDAGVIGPRPWLGHAAWPIEPAVLEKYVLDAYRRLGLRRVELDDGEVWRKLGAVAPTLGPSADVVVTRWAKTTDFARLFRRQLRSREGPRVLLHANVVALELSHERDRVAAVHARNLRGDQVTVRARQFVLASGSLEIVRLLKHPLVDASLPPWSGSKWLGSPLIDHLHCPVGTVSVLDYKRFHDLFDSIFIGGHKYYPRVRLAPEVQRSEGLVDVAAEFLYETRDAEHLEYLKSLPSLVRGSGNRASTWRDLARHIAALRAIALPLTRRRLRDRRSYKPTDAVVTLAFSCEQIPLERSRVDLSDERDAVGMRRLRVDWQIDGRELRSMKRLAYVLKSELEERGIASISLDPRLENDDPDFASAIHDAIHQMGTTRMGRSPDQGFVDENLKVFGSENLHLVGATAFPSTGYANPTLTALALALRLADHIVGISGG
jgi:choline dehydrogenase-like flavoprotein